MNAGPTASAGVPTAKVFISYRREETAAHAGRIYDATVARFGEPNVFMDVDLAPGIDFVERIRDAVGACHVLIVVIGPRWATVTDEAGGARIADSEDFVRLEVETALRRSDVTVIPALVGGGRMPNPEDLPEDVRTITRRNALELSDARWRYDVGRLMNALDERLAEMTGTHAEIQAPPEPAAPTAPNWRLILEGALVGGVAALLAGWLATKLILADIKQGSHPNDTAGLIGGVIARRAAVWAVAAAALAAWLTVREGKANPFRRAMSGLIIGAIAGAVGGALYALPVFLPMENLQGADANRIDVGSLALTGAFIGGLLGALWRPPRPWAGLATGAAAGAVTQLFLNAVRWTGFSAFGMRGAAIAGVTVAVLLALGAQWSASHTPASGRVADP